MPNKKKYSPKFVPSGARQHFETRRISNRDCIDKASGHSQTIKNDLLNSKQGQNEIIPQSTIQAISPPKTICKNRRSHESMNYEFKINENASFNIETENLKINTDIQLNSTNSTSNVNVNNKADKHQINTLHGLDADTLKKCLLLDPNKSNKVPQMDSYLQPTKPELNNESFKGKLYSRLKRNMQLKEEKKAASQNHSTPASEINANKNSNFDDENKCDCKNCDDFINCPTWYYKNLKFDEYKVTKKGLPLFKSNLMEKQPSIVKKFNNKIILHGNLIPNPIFSIDQTCLDGKIQSALQELNCTSAKEVQSYVWPTVQRGLSVFMVGPPKSGKTLAYLPLFCTFCIEKKERYNDLLKYEGPFIIILCSNVEGCYELQNLAKSITCHCADEAVIMVLKEDSLMQINCDMLIAVPSVLEQAVKSGTLKLKRLCHLAIEDGHSLLKNHSHSMKTLFQVMNQLQKNRPHNRNIQVVVSSQKWSGDLETLLIHLSITPLMCFEDFLEAAVYDKIKFEKKQLITSHKCFYLIDVLKTKYMTHKTVVFCGESDISTINERLQISGIECITISNSLIEDEIFENESMWKSLRIGYYKVLLCTDTVFEKTVHISNAQWLVHFCFPTDSAAFAKRFRCLSANLCSPLSEEDNVNQLSKWSCIIVDELCDTQLFLDFFQVLKRSSAKHLQL